MFACICHAVTEAAVVEAVDAGADSLEAISEVTFAGAGCGMCHDRIEDIVEERCGACPLAALASA
ncbi:MAG: (2Fe-2S)-binding protein [Candidatus Nanopelagicales bacterium]